MTARPSGWYDDPEDETQLRYWDGILWSDRTMPKLRPGLDHVGEARPTEHSDRPARRDGATRTYPAHWGPEEPSREQRFQGPRFTGVTHEGAPFGNTVGTTAGLVRRLLAALIDRFIVALPVSLVVLPFVGSWMDRAQRFMNEVTSAASTGEQTPSMPAELTTPPLAPVIALVAAMFVYDTLMTSFSDGSTLAKKMLGIKVMSADGGAGRVPLARSSLRALLKWGPDALAIVSVLAVPAGLLQLVILGWALTNAARQGLHDRAAKTKVVRTR